ncbi:MAG: ABC transporter substrate-binding protein [Alphaproteobacteria bacterium]|nr:ABC transporter substrate-binding protein [Alphaproteobacteria bacterium]
MTRMPSTARPDRAVRRRTALALLLGLVLALPFARPAMADPKAAESFIEDLALRVLNILNDTTIDETTRASRFSDVFLSNIALKSFGRSALGPYARVATPEELEAYYDLLEVYAVQTMQIRLGQFADSTVVVTSATEKAQGETTYTFVESDVREPGGTREAGVTWVLISQDGSSFKIYDINVVTPGESGSFSLLETQRAEFTSVIANNGRKISALLDFLRTEIDRTSAAG